MRAIGEEISEQLDIEPAKVRVIRHVRKKYACPHCNQGSRPHLCRPNRSRKA
ncbi:MAG: IS66 family transposase zinc-finger binding domain-containing protein [Pseudomonadota bacterium]|nr:IS66 family transposase zinc-finger binding domain-containing protein [Pseudomonadota bacterium]